MYRCESKVKLLSDDETYFHGEPEGCSSGYDSASDASDDESLAFSSSIKEDATNVNRVMRYTSTDALSDNLQIILSMPELCDVMFLVGNNKVPVYGVKAILSSRSKIIHKIILKAQQEQEVTSKSSKMANKSKKKSTSRQTVIKVRKYQAEDFRKIIHFIHCGKVDISKRTIAGLYCGAVQFGLSDLGRACSNFLSRSAKSSSICESELIQNAQNYTEHSAYQKYIEVVKMVFEEQICRTLMETQI